MKLHTVLRYVALTGVFLLPFVPLVVAYQLFFPFITGKNFAFRVITEIMFAAWLILAVIDPKYRPKWSWLPKFAVIFVCIMALADAVGVFPYKSFWSNFERMEGWVTLAHLVAYFFVVSIILNTERWWNWLMNTSIVVSLITVGYGFLQLAGKITINQGGVRLDATFGNATYLAVYMLFNIFLTLFIWVSPDLFILVPRLGRQPIKEKSIIAGLIILLQVIILYHTATRGAILGLFGGLFITAALLAWSAPKGGRSRKIALGVLAAIVVVIGGFILLRNAAFVKNSPVLSRFASISVSETTTKSRFYLWNMAIRGFQERPVLGWGQENFNYVFNKYYDPLLYNQEQWFDRTHNVIFDWLIAGGILGLASYLLFYGAIYWSVAKSHRFSATQKSVLIGLLSAYFIHNLFVFDNLISYLMFFTVAGYVYSKDAIIPRLDSSVEKTNRVILPLALIATVLVVYYVNVPALIQNRDLIKSLSPIQPSNPSVAANTVSFKKALADNSFGTPEVREQIMIMAQQAVSAGGAVAGAQDLGQLAIDEGQKQLFRTPNDARYYILYGSFLSGVGLYQSAEPVIAKGVQLTPKKQSALYILGSTYLGMKQYDKAVVTFKKAYDLLPENMEARAYYAVSLMYAKKNTEAAQLLKDVPQEQLADNDQILNAYYVSGQYKELLRLWKIRVDLYPKNPQYHLSLAAAYILNNDTNNAVTEIQKVIEMVPEFKTQGEQYIKDIRAGKQIF